MLFKSTLYEPCLSPDGGGGGGGGGTPCPDLDGGRDTPCLDMGWWYPPSRPGMGVSPPSRPGMGYSPPIQTWEWATPPPPMCEQTPVKTIPPLVLRTRAVNFMFLPFPLQPFFSHLLSFSFLPLSFVFLHF